MPSRMHCFPQEFTIHKPKHIQAQKTIQLGCVSGPQGRLPSPIPGLDFGIFGSGCLGTFGSVCFGISGKLFLLVEGNLRKKEEHETELNSCSDKLLTADCCKSFRLSFFRDSIR